MCVLGYWCAVYVLVIGVRFEFEFWASVHKISAWTYIVTSSQKLIHSHVSSLLFHRRKKENIANYPQVKVLPACRLKSHPT